MFAVLNAIEFDEAWLLELRAIEREALERAIRNIAIKQRGDAFVEAARDMLVHRQHINGVENGRRYQKV